MRWSAMRAEAGSAWCTGWRARFKGALCSRPGAKRRKPGRRDTIASAGRVAEPPRGLPDPPREKLGA
jgi:hypothetical protein